MKQVLKLQFFDLLGTDESVYLDISEDTIDDWIDHGLRDLVAHVTQLNPLMLDYMAIATELATGPVDVSGYQRSSIVGVTRNYLDSDDAVHNVPVRELPGILGGGLTDPNSIYYAIPSDPGMYYKGATLTIVPVPSATEKAYIHHVAYGDVDCSVDESIADIADTNFPDELNQVVLLYAVIQAKIREYGVIRKRGWDDYASVTGVTTVTATTYACSAVTSKVITHSLGYAPAYRCVNSSGEEEFPEVDENSLYTITTFTFAVAFTGTIFLYLTTGVGGLLEAFQDALPTWSAPTPPTITAFAASFDLTAKPDAGTFTPSITLTAKPNAASFTPSITLTAKPANVAAFSPSIALTAIPAISSFTPTQTLTGLLSFSSFSPTAMPGGTVSFTAPTAPDITGGAGDVVITTLPSDLNLDRMKNALNQAAGFLYKFWDESLTPDAAANTLIATDAYSYITAHDTEEAKLSVEASNAFSRVGETEVQAQIKITEQWVSEVKMLIEKYNAEIRAAVGDVEAQAQLYASATREYAALVSSEAQGFGDEVRAEAQTYSARVSGEANEIQAEASAYGAKVTSDARQFAERISAEASQINAEAQAYVGEHSADVKMYGDRVQAEANQIGSEAQAYAAEESAKANLYASRISAEANQIGSEAQAFAAEESAKANLYASRVGAEANELGTEAQGYAAYVSALNNKYIGDIQAEFQRNTMAIEEAKAYLLAIQTTVQGITALFSQNGNKVYETNALYQDYMRRIYAYCRVQQQQTEQRS